MDLIPMPSALLSCLLLFPLRGQESRQKQVGIGHRGRSLKNGLSRRSQPTKRASVRWRSGTGWGRLKQNEGLRDDRAESSDENLEMNLSE